MRRLALLIAATALLGVAAVAGGVAFFLSRSDPVELVTEAPALPADSTPVAATGEVLHFVVVPEQSEASYIAREKLAGYKVPRSWDFLEEFPRTPTGKLQKRLLRDPYWAGRERAI